METISSLRADLPAGPVTAGDIFSVLPFGNELVLIDMDGRIVHRWQCSRQKLRRQG